MSDQYRGPWVPPQPQPPAPSAPTKGRGSSKFWLIATAPAFLLGLTFGVLGGTSTSAAPPATTAGPTSYVTATESGPTTVVTQPAPAAKTVTSQVAGPTETVTARVPGPTKTVTAPAPPRETVTAKAKAPRTTDPTQQPDSDKKGLTASQENAIESARSYLDFTAFSRKGLIQQLSSDAGEGYSKKDATFAVDSLHIDYNKQAAKSAKEYLKTMAFSRKGLIEQLSSDAGEGYTRAQAEYGVKQAGL